MKIFISTFSVISILLLLSCTRSCIWQAYSPCKYTVAKNHIESSCDLYSGFYFEKIKVDSLDFQGVPIKYKAEYTISFSPKNIDEEPEIKRVNFYIENIGYEWHHMSQSSLHATLPIKMKPENWYLIRLDGSTKYIFIYIDNKGEYSFYYPNSRASW